MFGEKVRSLREQKGLVLRQLAAALDIDTATMSKIELGDRQARQKHLLVMAEKLEVDYRELHTLWLADKIYDLIANEDDALEALTVAKEQVAYWRSLNKV